MMKKWKLSIIVITLLALLIPTTAFAKEPFEDKVVFGGTFTLESGETHNGSLVIFGGAVTVEPDSTVNGDVVLLGGTVEVGGKVNGSLVGIGGSVRLTAEAVVNGDLVTIGATLRREEGAQVSGEVVDGMNIPFELDVPNPPVDGAAPPAKPNITVHANPFLEMIWFFFRTFLFAGLAVLLVMFFGEQTNRVARAALSQPIITAGAGLLTAFLAPLAIVTITITIILIPVSFVAILLLFAAWLMGWIALGAEVGRRITQALNQEWAPAISAGLGTFVLLFVLGGFKQVVPCIGWLPQVLVGIWGLGAVLMTRFGTQEYTTFESAGTGKTTPALVDEAIPQVVVEVEETPASESAATESDVLNSSDEDVRPDDDQSEIKD